MFRYNDRQLVRYYSVLLVLRSMYLLWSAGYYPEADDPRLTFNIIYFIRIERHHYDFSLTMTSFKFSDLQKYV